MIVHDTTQQQQLERRVHEVLTPLGETGYIFGHYPRGFLDYDTLVIVLVLGNLLVLTHHHSLSIPSVLFLRLLFSSYEKNAPDILLAHPANDEPIPPIPCRRSKPHSFQEEPRSTADFADAIALLSKDLQDFRKEKNQPFEELTKKWIACHRFTNNVHGTITVASWSLRQSSNTDKPPVHPRLLVGRFHSEYRILSPQPCGVFISGLA